MLLNIVCFVFLCLFSFCSFIIYFYRSCMLSKRDNHNLKKRTRENKFENKSMHHAKVSFGLKKHEITYASELDEFGWYNYIMFYRRRSVFCRLWLNSKTFTYTAFLTHANHATHAKISTTLPTPKFQPTPPTSPTPKCYGPTLPTIPTPKFDPRTHATHAI